MTEEMRKKRLRSMVGTSVIVALAALVVILVMRPRSGEPRELLGRGALVVCALVVGLRIFGAIRRRLRSQRAAPLVASSRSPDRVEVVPAELGRILAEVTGATGSREQHEKSLAARLGALVERRELLWAGRAPLSSGRLPAEGTNLRELGKIVAEIEER